jgi:hypothetical protein
MPELMKACICNSKTSSFRPPICRRIGCDGITTEGLMRECKRYISVDDDVFKGEPVWRKKKIAPSPESLVLEETKQRR